MEAIYLILKNLRAARRRFGLALLIALIVVLGAVVTAQSGSAIKVTILADGQEWEYVSTADTVGGVLKEAGVTLGKLDRCSYKLDTEVVTGMTIRITRIEEKVVTTKRPVPFETVVKYDPRHRGANAVFRKGEPGEKEVKLRIFYKDGVQSTVQTLEVKVIRQPKDQIVASSQRQELTSRGGTRVRTLRMLATAYDPGPRSCGPRATGHCANGMHAGKGVVAVDPRVIRLGTRLYVEGYGYCIAADTGGAIKGNKIDLCYNTYGEAIRFGRKYVTVHVLR